jgi:hypothetical protein
MIELESKIVYDNETLLIYTGIDVGNVYSKNPLGRTTEDGEYNAIKFRDMYLVPLLVSQIYIIVDFESCNGIASNWLEECFGGLVRMGFNKEYLKNHIKFVDESIELECLGYIEGVMNDNER